MAPSDHDPSSSVRPQEDSIRTDLGGAFSPELCAVRTVIGTEGKTPRGGSERGDDGSRT